MEFFAVLILCILVLSSWHYIGEVKIAHFSRKKMKLFDIIVLMKVVTAYIVALKITLRRNQQVAIFTALENIKLIFDQYDWLFFFFI